ncbi:MAG TPA: RNA polymerase sigma factor [Puia sp.]|nr:RNA polymerase sigma factor [Puia sp.]
MPHVPNDMNEKEQLLLLQEGDEKAFETIYYQYSLSIYRKIIRLVKVEHIAGDLTQEVFVRLWEKKHLVDVQAPLFPYLSKIAVNLVMDFYRKAGRDRVLKAAISHAIAATTDAADQKALQGEYGDMLREAILHLPVRQQSVFQLCKVEGLSHEEAGSKLGISPATVNNHIVKASRAIKSFLLRYHLFFLLVFFLPR